MDRKIVIKGCGQCPYVDHRGGFGHISYIPCCMRVNPTKNLPYRIAKGHGDMVVANGTGVIPEWCPLTEN